MPRNVVVFDCDGCVCDGHTPPRVHPDRETTILRLLAAGHDIRLWSAAGRSRAVAVWRALGCPLGITCHTKPSRPIRLAAAVRVLGVEPDLIVDNDPAHRVQGVPFMLVDSWWGASTVGADPLQPAAPTSTTVAPPPAEASSAVSV